MFSKRLREVAIGAGAGVSGRIPGRFGMAHLLNRSCSLRCVVFHHIAAQPTPFTTGIRVTVSPRTFESALQFLTKHYTPVSLDDVLTDCGGRGLPLRPVLLTFDDAYASIAEVAAPLCRKYGVPAVFFVNAAFVNNRRMAPDNLVCYVAHFAGMDVVNAAIREVPGREDVVCRGLTEVFGSFFPTLSLKQRELFLHALCRLAEIDDSRLAKEANLYLTGHQLRNLGCYGFEVGNHTYSHTHCRSLSHREVVAEIMTNKSELESICGRRVRSFSQPYGSSKDVTGTVEECLRQSGHEAVFLSESVANQRNANPFRLDRVSTCAASDEALFFELEVLPRLRAHRNQLHRKAGSVQAAELRPQ